MTLAASIAMFRKAKALEEPGLSRQRLVIERILEEDADMTFVGLAVTFLGFVIAFISLGVTDSTGGAAWAWCSSGIVVSLIGIMGVITPAYQKTWIWKR